jgi:carboxyl-terminal processing protease
MPIILVVLIGVSFFIGMQVGRSGDSELSPLVVESPDAPADVRVDFSPFWKAWRILDERFVSSSTTTTHTATNQERVWGAISGMVDALDDPYTIFLPPEESKIFEGDINGNFEGVGMEIGMSDGILTVIAPLRGTPAFRAGVQPGDKILKIDDTITDGLNTDQAVRLIRGKVGTKVRLTVLRGEEEPFVITVTRAVIDIPTLDYEIRSDGIFVIRLYNFSASSPNLFRAALREFVRTGSNKLLLDLRGNPGGFLEASVDMASWFLPSGTVVVREEYKDGREQVLHRSRGYDIFPNNLKMAILIDGGSASAAEILAGALSENGVAKLVGSTSFGKGSVQELIKITPDSSLKVTIAQWLTPNGQSISASGVKPDIEVERTAADVKAGRDPQLVKAVEYLRQ